MTSEIHVERRRMRLDMILLLRLAITSLVFANGNLHLDRCRSFERELSTSTTRNRHASQKEEVKNVADMISGYEFQMSAPLQSCDELLEMKPASFNEGTSERSLKGSSGGGKGGSGGKGGKGRSGSSTGGGVKSFSKFTHTDWIIFWCLITSPLSVCFLLLCVFGIMKYCGCYQKSASLEPTLEEQPAIYSDESR